MGLVVNNLVSRISNKLGRDLHPVIRGTYWEHWKIWIWRHNWQASKYIGIVSRAFVVLVFELISPITGWTHWLRGQCSRITVPGLVKLGPETVDSIRWFFLLVDIELWAGCHIRKFWISPFWAHAVFSCRWEDGFSLIYRCKCLCYLFQDILAVLVSCCYHNTCVISFCVWLCRKVIRF